MNIRGIASLHKRTMEIAINIHLLFTYWIKNHKTETSKLNGSLAIIVTYFLMFTITERDQVLRLFPVVSLYESRYFVFNRAVYLVKYCTF